METVKDIKEFYEIIIKENPFIENREFIEIDNSEILQSFLKSKEIKFESIQKKLRIDFIDLQILIFSSIEDYLTFPATTDDSKILIIQLPNTILFLRGSSFINFKLNEEYYLFKNTICYDQFKDFLKIHEKDNEEPFTFVDSYNTDLRKLIFISLSDKGRIILKYDNSTPFFEVSNNYQIGFNLFQDCFNEQSYILPKFLKNAIINTLSNVKIDERFKYFFEHLPEIVEKAKINFNVYLNNLSIDSIKKDYDDIKTKYFNSLSDILSKFTQQIIALPIGISATLFAIDKINSKVYYLLIILFTILLTTVYLTMLLKIHFKDLLYIWKVFKVDYEHIKENNFFKTYPNESKFLDEIYTRIKEKIDFLKVIIESYFWVLNISNLIIIGFIIAKLSIGKMNFIVFGIIGLLLITIFRNKILNADEKESKI